MARRPPKNTPVSVGGVPLTAEQAAALAAASPELAAALGQASAALTNAAGATAGAARAAAGSGGGIGSLFGGGGMTAAGTAVSGRPGKGLFPVGYSSEGEVKASLFPEGFRSSGGVREEVPAGVETVDFVAAGKAMAGAGAARGAARAAGVAAGGAEAAGGLAAAANPVAAGFQLVVQAAAAVVGKLNAFERETLAANAALREFSPSLAQVFGQRDVRERFRALQTGEALAPSARTLVEAEQRTQDNRQAIDQLAGTVRNNFAAGWEDVKANFFIPLNEIAKAVNEILGIGKRKDGEPIGFGDWVEDIRKNAEEARRRKEERLKRPEFQDAPNGRRTPGV